MTRPHMKVLHVIPSLSSVHGGPSRAMVTIERALAAAGIDVTTVTTDDDGPGRRLGSQNLPAEANGAERVYVRKWIEFYKVAPGLVPWLWRNVRQFDAIHIHAMFSFTSIAAGFLAQARGVPYVVRPLGTLSRYGVTKRRPLLKRLSLCLIESAILRGAAYVHFTSADELTEARALGLAFKGGVVPLGVEELPTGRAARANNKRGLQSPGGDPLTILFLSRLDPKKNVESLLEAFAIARVRHPTMTLRIAGDGPEAYVQALKGRASALSVASRVEWLGHVEGEAKADAFASADVFVLPSFSENFGIAAVEGMLAGLPCILGEGIGISVEAAAAGAARRVAPAPSEIAAALIDLHDDAAARARMGRAAMAFAQQEYSTNAMAERLTRLYRSIAPSNLDPQT